ncbi:MAG: hypothetical protein OQK49_04310, partial [Proteobacteria bacterium]|nr:hypothetical protein [Pseudomonadota bacterium]
MLTNLNWVLKPSALLITVGILLIFSVLLSAQTMQYQLSGLQVNHQDTGTSINMNELFVAPDIRFSDIRYQCKTEADIYPTHDCQQAELMFDLQEYRLQLSGQVYYDVIDQILKVDAVDKDNTMVFKYDSARQSQDIQLSNWPINKWLPP